MAQYSFKGVVKDSTFNEPIPYVSIYIKGGNKGVISSVDGKFSFTSASKKATIRLQAVGYATKEITLKAGDDKLIYMATNATALDEVVVRRHREKYVKKGNPAVAFIEQARAHMHDRDPFQHDYYSYDKYERMSYGLNNLTDEKISAMEHQFKGLAEFIDSSEITHKKILAISLNEKISTDYFRKNPSTHKEYVTAQQHAGLDENLESGSIQKFLGDAFTEVDIYCNDVRFMMNRFVSPLSNIGTSFYKYYLNDTIMVDGERCVELDFVPFNSQAFGFIGRLYFPLNDTTYFIKKIEMGVPKAINLNYVQRIYINQEFVKAPDGSRLKTRDDLTLEFKVLGPEIFARRSTHYSNHSFAPPADMEIFSRGGEQIVAKDAEGYSEDFFKEHRPDVLKQDTHQMHALIKKLRSSKLFYWAEKIIVTLAKGYVPTAKVSKFDVGPLNTIINGNELEGLRVRFGGMTTANLSKHWFARCYAAYGFKDEKLKYQTEVEYSFNEKKYHSYEFPVHSLKATHQYDVDKVGQHYMYTSQDNIFLLLKRKKDDKINYLRQTKLEYTLELSNGFSLKAGMQHDVHEASYLLPFVDGAGICHPNYHEVGLNVTLRYAPGEKFFQTRSYRFPINIDNPIFTINHIYQPKGFMGNTFEVNKTEVGVQKRFWFSAWGYTDVIVKAGKVWSKVAYPDLLIPNANLSYTIQNESYTLMNAMEFANDQYASWDVTYWLNGALLNYVPLLKKLKLREAVSFRGLYGSLSDKNNPEKNDNLYRFPNGTCQSQMDKTPYMELGVGLDNILTCLRLDYVWRLTYRDAPGACNGGLRVLFHMTF